MKNLDYPFLSSLAQFGIIGNILFFPIYVYIYRLIYIFLKKRKLNVLEANDEMLLLFVVAFFLSKLIIYMNFFDLLVNSYILTTSYVYIGLFLGLYNKWSVMLDKARLEYNVSHN